MGLVSKQTEMERLPLCLYPLWSAGLKKPVDLT